MPATRVYPIPGRFAVGVPLIEHEVASKAEADRLVATGVFALSAKEAADAAFTTPEATPATDANVKQPAKENPSDAAE
jgi:hypothetical protein